MNVAASGRRGREKRRREKRFYEEKNKKLEQEIETLRTTMLELEEIVNIENDVRIRSLQECENETLQSQLRLYREFVDELKKMTLPEQSLKKPRTKE